MSALWTVIGTLLLAIFTFVANYVYARYKLFQLFKNVGIPGPKPHFFKGNTVQMKSGSLLPLENLSKWYKKYGKIFGYYKGKEPILVVGDLEFVKQILTKDSANFTNRLRPPVVLNKYSVLSLEGQRWKEVRKTLTPAFSASKLKQITNLMNKAVAVFANELSKVTANGKEVDIYDRFQRLTLEVIGESALAMKVTCQHEEKNEFYENVRDTMKNSSSRFVTLATYVPEFACLTPFLFYFRTSMSASINVMNNLKSVVKYRRSQSSRKTLDMLQFLLEASEESSNDCKMLNDIEIVDNCWVFILAGFETTATSLAYISYLLSIHQDVQERVYQEIITNIPDTENPSYDDASNLPYLSQVINEALRLYPPVPLFVTRASVKDYELDGKMIPKEVSIMIPVYCLHHDPDLWLEPEKFDPERFSLENKSNIFQMSHLPFGAGPRNCIGMRFALLEIKLAMIRLLTKNRLVQSDEHINPPELFVPHVTYVPKNGLYVKVEPRV